LRSGIIVNSFPFTVQAPAHSGQLLERYDPDANKNRNDYKQNRSSPPKKFQET